LPKITIDAEANALNNGKLKIKQLVYRLHVGSHTIGPGKLGHMFGVFDRIV